MPAALAPFRCVLSRFSFFGSVREPAKLDKALIYGQIPSFARTIRISDF
jgi:hypothetical protein